MASSHKKKTVIRITLVVVLCLILIAAVSAAMFFSLVSRRVKAFQAGASFSLDYEITAVTDTPPALYQLLTQFGGTTGSLDGQYSPEALQLNLSAKNAVIPASPLTRVYISPEETLFDVRQLYRNIRSAIVDEYPLAGILMPEWSMGDYISQTQLASLLGVDADTIALQDMTGFSLDLKSLKRIQPENGLDGYLYFQLPADGSSPNAPVLTLGVEKKDLLRTESPKVHILLDIPEHGIHAELKGTVTASKTVLTAPTSRMKDDDIAALAKLRETIESVWQFVQAAA